jgi:hypothetical protein
MPNKNSIIQQIANVENLFQAWEKVKWFYKPGDIWFDEVGVASFDALIDDELKRISSDILSGVYRPSPIAPVPFPKRKDKEPKTRQTFWVAIRDQVTWIAVVNIIGKYLDSKMPFWSYGNRLYISTFYDSDPLTGQLELKFGFYRNTSKYTYRKWTQSWPLYRRHIYLTSKFLANGKKVKDLEELELETLRVNENLAPSHPLKVPYLDDTYWEGRKKKKLYWAGLDFEKFYPRVNLNTVETNLISALPFKDEGFERLLENLLKFEVNSADWAPDELEEIQLNKEELLYKGLPTGLFVSGFLANVALLKVDQIITKNLQEDKRIAQFRYVDDHVLIASSFKALSDWVDSYQSLLETHLVLHESSNPFNHSKTQPPAFGEYLTVKLEKAAKTIESEALDLVRKKAESECRLDPDFPSPLMTQTLTKVSKIAGTEFRLLDPEEQKGLILDIEHLLLTEFPDNELRRDTRISFAARMLSTHAPNVRFDRKTIHKLCGDLAEKKKKISRQHDDPTLQNAINELQNEIQKEEDKISSSERKFLDRTIKLLRKAVRENHEKVRLWTRLLEFCFKSDLKIEKEVFAELDYLRKENEASELSISFILALMLNVICHQIFAALRILESEHSLHFVRRRAGAFIKNVVSRSFLLAVDKEVQKISSKRYLREARNALKVAISTAVHTLDGSHNEFIPRNWKILLKDFDLPKWTASQHKVFLYNEKSFEAWAWWALSQYQNSLELTPPKLWLDLVERVDIEEPIGRSLAFLYPKHLNTTVLKKIDGAWNLFSEKYSNEGILFDIQSGLNERKIKYSPNFLAKIKDNEKSFKGYVTLDKWIRWTFELYRTGIDSRDQTILFDPRLGEWVALDIIKCIAQEAASKIETVEFDQLKKTDLFAKSMHPRNFKISKKLINTTKEGNPLTWSDTRNILSKRYLEYVPANNFLSDSRFVPPFGRFTLEEKIESVLNGLGSILICLFSKSMDMPIQWNPIGHQRRWLDMAKKVVNDLALSSYSTSLILGCFSKRNRETHRLLQTMSDFSFRIDEDFNFDPPRFTSISDFVKYVEFTQRQLEFQQLSITGHQPRQLIPVSLIRMNETTYVDIFKNEE